MPSGTSSSCAISLRRLRSAGTGDLARDAAAARRVRHQHGVAAGERKIGRQRRAFVAALFLDDLDQDDLVALDDFLNLVVPPAPLVPLRQLFQRVLGADDLDRGRRCRLGNGNDAAAFAVRALMVLPVLCSSPRRMLRRGFGRFGGLFFAGRPQRPLGPERLLRFLPPGFRRRRDARGFRRALLRRGRQRR